MISIMSSTTITEQMMTGIAATVTHDMKTYPDPHLEAIERRFDNVEIAMKNINEQNASIDKRLIKLENNAAEVQKENRRTYHNLPMSSP
jgi:thioester reductase-like protein